MASELSSFTFKDVHYSVDIGKLWRKKNRKEILKGISGIFKPGLNAILGPTGGGKTSLLDLLAKRRSTSTNQFSGNILINGAPLPNNFKMISGYVVQDDVVMGTLTVKENLMFAAHMRLGGNITESERKERVNEIIKQLQLTKCANTKIGTDLVKGVSGGERKRCNIGMELIIQPEILFLDEPTTGLDSTTSLTVVNLLKDIAENGNKIIIFSIHQPRFAIFRLFNRLHLLSSNGETVYHGLADNAIKYFADLNFVCEPHNNPADFFLDTIIAEAFHKEIEEQKKPLALCFAESSDCKEIDEEIKNISTSADNVRFSAKSITRSISVQLLHLSIRSLRNISREPKVSIIPIVIYMFQAFVIGMFYMDTTNDLNGFQNIYGALFFVSLQLMFGSVAALEVFINSRNLYLHEMANGYYSQAPFFLSKVFSDLLPLRAVPTSIFSIAIYLLLGFKKDFSNFVFFWISNIATTMCACSLVFFVSINIAVFAIANSIAVVFFVVMILFAGLIINISSMPLPLQYFQYISIPRYSLKALAANELTDRMFCGNRTIGINQTAYFCESGESLLDLQEIDHTGVAKWMNVLSLCFFMSLMFTFSYIRIYFIKKDK